MKPVVKCDRMIKKQNDVFMLISSLNQNLLLKQVFFFINVSKTFSALSCGDNTGIANTDTLTYHYINSKIFVKQLFALPYLTLDFVICYKK